MEFLIFRILCVLAFAVSLCHADSSLFAKVSEKDGVLKVDVLSGSPAPMVVALSSFKYRAEIRYRVQGKWIKLVKKGDDMWPMQTGLSGFLFLGEKKERTIGPPKRLTIRYSLPDKHVDLVSVKIWVRASSYDPAQSVGKFLSETRFGLIAVEWKKDN